MATYQEQLERYRAAREAKEKAEAERKARMLSPEQIKNWRGVLFRIVGPYAHIMPDEMVQEFKDRFAQQLGDEPHGDNSRE